METIYFKVDNASSDPIATYGTRTGTGMPSNFQWNVAANDITKSEIITIAT